MLHLIIVRPPVNAALMSSLSLTETPLSFLRPMQTPAERQLLFDAAAVTGGAVHGATANDVIVHKVNAVDMFRKVLDEFRQSTRGSISLRTCPPLDGTTLPSA